MLELHSELIARNLIAGDLIAGDLIAGEFVDRSLRAEVMPRPNRLIALIERFLDWRDRARQRRHLSALSTHMLKDIGLTAVEVEAELNRRSW